MTLHMNPSFISVFTPVYNGEQYLAQCIESVLAQDYTDFEYLILNNCSTDGSLDIAESYAKSDRRVRVRTNATFVSAIENHNLGFRLVPPSARFCKVVSADDWIMSDCLRKMVRLAEAHPNVGIVGCYQRSADKVKWQGIPPEVDVISGREAARLGLLKGIHVLGTPTSVLYRADLLRLRQDFFPHLRSHADTSACYESFEVCDLGFLHEVLAVERVHAGQWTSEMDALEAGSVAYLDIMLRYGPCFLDADEFAARRDEVIDSYYRALGGTVWKLKSSAYWRFQRSRLAELGYALDLGKVAGAALKEAFTEARHPSTALRKVLQVLRSA